MTQYPKYQQQAHFGTITQDLDLLYKAWFGASRQTTATNSAATSRSFRIADPMSKNTDPSQPIIRSIHKAMKCLPIAALERNEIILTHHHKAIRKTALSLMRTWRVAKFNGRSILLDVLLYDGISDLYFADVASIKAGEISESDGFHGYGSGSRPIDALESAIADAARQSEDGIPLWLK